MHRMNLWASAWFKAMAAIVDNSLLDVHEINYMAITLNIHTKSHTVRGRPTLNLWSVLGTGRSANFTRDQFTSDPLRANLLSRNVKRNLLYQASYLILCLHVNTTVYLDVIENPVEHQKLLWNVSEERAENWRNLFMSVFVQAYRSPLGYVVMWRLEKLQRVFVRLIRRG